jgi:hypothetical protein
VVGVPGRLEACLGPGVHLLPHGLPRERITHLSLNGLLHLKAPALIERFNPAIGLLDVLNYGHFLFHLLPGGPLPELLNILFLEPAVFLFKHSDVPRLLPVLLEQLLGSLKPLHNLILALLLHDSFILQLLLQSVVLFIFRLLKLRVQSFELLVFLPELLGLQFLFVFPVGDRLVRFVLFPAEEVFRVCLNCPVLQF